MQSINKTKKANAAKAAAAVNPSKIKWAYASVSMYSDVLTKAVEINAKNGSIQITKSAAGSPWIKRVMILYSVYFEKSLMKCP